MTYHNFDIRPHDECTPVHPDLTHTQVRSLVAAHSQKLRQNEKLGAVYQTSMRCDWEDYESQAVRFWCSALMKDQSYSGRPVNKYREAAKQLSRDDIANWLELFEDAVESCVTATARTNTMKCATQVVDCFHMAMFRA
ncbi:Group 3 truncated hemoglobin ctb [Pseudovibrio axinellae]|uniref:Group 3 truncated hemoglobin ctb n=1 Tax=Pseudovibrio axinellae TaxID=989403 RepID=A0A165T6C3_9HYPH|nr:group III truncated hemoglobin [Pseudovibrio axinellae]KZL05496.1 Group 3 truncated hemoglobin ctb [Pseudovibrio axinellae]SEP96733.1 hemoglobin [Pseudovibrio axinellae]